MNNPVIHTNINNILTKQHTVVEGFEMVTKTSFIRNRLSDHIHYHATHDLTDHNLGRENAWALGYAIYDLLSQSHEQGNRTFRVAVDRHIVSSMTYTRLYQDIDIPEEVLEFYSDNDYYIKGINHVYLCHKDKESAKVIYEASMNREDSPNAISNSYDRFANFEEYWDKFLLFDAIMRSAYSRLGITPIIVYPEGGQWYTDSKDIKGLKICLS